MLASVCEQVAVMSAEAKVGWLGLLIVKCLNAPQGKKRETTLWLCYRIRLFKCSVTVQRSQRPRTQDSAQVDREQRHHHNNNNAKLLHFAYFLFKHVVFAPHSKSRKNFWKQIGY